MKHTAGEAATHTVGEAATHAQLKQQHTQQVQQHVGVRVRVRVTVRVKSYTTHRKSSLVPTKIIGVFGQWCDTSGYHFALTFSNEAGLMMEKPAVLRDRVQGWMAGVHG